MSRNDFSYKIDYDKEIAYDRVQIALLKSPITKAVAAAWTKNDSSTAS